MSGKDNNFPHILTASSTLLGLCFVVLTSMHVTNTREASLIDEFTAGAIVMFMASSLLSYLSMRSTKDPKPGYEKIADVVFLSGLIFLFITTMLIAFNVIK
jgi:predicted membrane channel-forming protein YqfA (hemolysin III family)